MDKQKIIIIALTAALILTVQYFVLDRWISSAQQEISQNYQRGYTQGLNDAVVSLYDQTQNCHPATIVIGNLTKKVFDLACIENSSEKSSP